MYLFATYGSTHAGYTKSNALLSQPIVAQHDEEHKPISFVKTKQLTPVRKSNIV
jgi:hypothetical protein